MNTHHPYQSILNRMVDEETVYLRRGDRAPAKDDHN